MGLTVYTLRSLRGNGLYIGHTNDLVRRLEQHNDPDGKGYTAKRGPWVLVHWEDQLDRRVAMARERFLKSPAGAPEKWRLAGL